MVSLVRLGTVLSLPGGDIANYLRHNALLVVG